MNHYSIDVALGAMVSSIYFGRLLGVDLSSLTVITLGLTVWAIYTFDHLIDGRRLTSHLNSRRHFLHKKYKTPLSMLLVAVLVSLSVLIFFIPPKTVVLGVSVLCGVFAYFVALSLLKVRFGYYKEIIISVIYTVGVLVGPLSLATDISLMHVLIIGAFGLLAFLNLVIFSWYEKHLDKVQQFASIVNALGGQRSILLLKVSFGLVVVFVILIAVQGHFEHAILLSSMTLFLAVLVVKQSLFKKNLVYRILGDGIFILPALVL